ncbi:MAG: right-handed parallel beta-helix repeat-containing protein [Anaerolineae bacterium]|jgi:parallel beta-helix repeat protein
MKQAATRGMLILALLVMSGQAAGAATQRDTGAMASVYYVDQGHPSASNSNDGSEGSPWLTVQKAADTAIAGDVVYIKNGTYYEIVTAEHSGSSGNLITFKAYPGHSPMLDGTGQGGWYGVFTIQGEDYIRLEGLEIRNNSTGWGVLVEHEDGNAGNAATNIELVDLEVHHTSGEAIQIRGNAHHVLVQDCVVHDGDTYSGIDIYQWGGGRPHHVTVSGCTAYDYPGFSGIASEQADNLVVENNVTYSSSLGIDIGSGDDNVIRNNVVHDCDTGIALSSNEDSEVYGNTIYNIYDEAIYSYYWSTHGEGHARNKWYDNTVYNAGFGIYESNVRYDPGPSSDHEYYNNLFYDIGTHGSYRTPFYFRGTTDLKFYNNTLYLNPNYDAIELYNGSVNADIRDNIISTSGSVSPIIVDGSSTPGTVIDYNCYHNRSGGSAGPGAHSVAADPKFTPDFHLQDDSPCIDVGVDLSAHHTTDKDGVPRPQGAGWDIGAYEFAPALALYGTPGNGVISLNWTVSASLPATSTWQISYYTDTVASSVVETDTLTNTASAYVLTDLENGHWYTVTLTTVGVTPPLSDTVAVQLMGHFAYLPIVTKEN